MVSHRAINDIIQTPKKEVHSFFFSVILIKIFINNNNILYFSNFSNKSVFLTSPLASGILFSGSDSSVSYLVFLKNALV